MSEKGFTIWFTGLSGAGKTTISKMVSEKLRERGRKVELLDGDIVRRNLSKGLGFSKEDRDINIRRIGFVCHLLSKNGVVAIAAAISPYESVRQENRKLISDYVEVHARCPIDVLKERDAKGLYKKALAGEIQNFTGVSDPYESPENPDVVCDSDKESPEESAAKVIIKLEELGYIESEKTASGYTKEEEEKVNERLKALGYL
ncbi:adenylyl-sulfate kinase [candidate division LCP-89 bacterium B3_LCP]|uniref:Adenylyl-sulfate kinase n=1 Tax=candidate division LCP-89 bacterium B3_LCP TaxID=2012998 RepID=A0A532V5W0_UNCL8|nr:MAG: adenylyl-sulfate kinase [candidate division LCP-89 bacterium B3_LCP]